MERKRVLHRGGLHCCVDCFVGYKLGYVVNIVVLGVVMFFCTERCIEDKGDLPSEDSISHIGYVEIFGRPPSEEGAYEDG